MAETNTPLGIVNLWSRATDVTTLTECQMKYALSRLYDRDAETGYFISGTAGHLYASERLEGATPEAAWEVAELYMIEELRLAAANGKEVRWTKKRPAEDAFETLRELCQRWESDLGPLYFDQGWHPVGIEHTTTAEVDGVPVSTQIDSIWMRDNGTYQIVDWKFGATAKANPMQLHIYGWAARHCSTSPIYGVPAEYVGLVFHHTAFSKQQEVDFMSDPYVVALLQWATRQKEDMVKTGFAPAKPDWYCDYCLYQSHCPIYDGDLTEIADLLQSAGIEERPTEV